jgi:hypothetical protein
MRLDIKIPTDLNEITLRQYQKFLSICKDNDDETFINQKMIQIFCNVEFSLIVHFPFNTVNEIVGKINALFDFKDIKLTQRFDFKGKEFGFIPNLDDITFGEYTDLDTYIVDWDNMNKAMAVLYRPIVQKSFRKTYEIERYEGSDKYSESMLDLPLGIVFGANVFFYNLGNELLQSTLNYLEANQEVAKILEQHNSVKNGDIIVLSMLSLKETLQNLMPLRI